MRRLLLIVLCAGCSPSTTPSPSDGGPSVTPDAGSTPVDAGRTIPQNPSLDDLESVWNDVVCHVYACARHTRETPEMCERARSATGWPYDVFRRARASIR